MALFPSAADIKETTMKRIPLILTISLSLPAIAGGPVGGNATEVTQLANNTELILSYTEQARQTVTQLNQYASMLQNLKQMQPGPLAAVAAQKLWQDQNMNSTFRDLYRITMNGQRMAYNLQSMDGKFTQLHPGYGNFTNFNYQSAYQNWSDNNRNSTLAALRLSNVNADDLMSEGDLMNELRTKSETSDGQLQAVQAGNQIGISLVGQLQKLRQLQLSQIQAQNTNALSDQGRRDAEDDILLKRYFGGSGVRPDPAKGKTSNDN